MKLNIDFEKVVQSQDCKAIMEAEEFYFQEGRDVLHEFQRFQPTDNGFWDEFLQSFEAFWKNKEDTERYSDFIESLGPGDAYDFALLCARLIAHVDTKACDKHKYNSSGRAIAQTGIRQNVWIPNLVLYKKGTPADNGILYGLSYLDDPLNEINIVSQKHLKWILENGFGESYLSREQAVKKLKDHFSQLQPVNELNLTAVISSVLYHPAVSSQWKEEKDAKSKDSTVADLEEMVRDFHAKKDAADRPTVDEAQNLILYGPPGTGKTYNSINHAVALCKGIPVADVIAEDEVDHEAVKAAFDGLVDAGQIVFTTFHQSMGYEDFVEGIKPQEDEDSGIRYEVVDGIFKQVCRHASVKTVVKENTAAIDLTGRRYWKMSLGNTAKTEDEEIYSECIENDYILLGWGWTYDYSGCGNSDEIFDILKNHDITNDKSAYEVTAINTFVREMRVGDLVIVSDGNRKFRAIAEITGGYERLDGVDRDHYRQKRSVKWLRVYDPSQPTSALLSKYFSQKTIYELRYALDKDKLTDLLSGEPEESNNGKAKPHVLIIDEINRGNVSAILGELITLLEPDKRIGQENELRVTLPYSQDSDFGVPSNLHIVGTMNTADRSVEALDTALRRRFTFKEMMPSPSLLPEEDVNGVNLRKMLTAINRRLEALVGRDHTIGHAFFMKVNTLDDLKDVFHAKVLPQLQEYFYGDWAKINLVLGKRFVIQEDAGDDVLWPEGSDPSDEYVDRKCWKITKRSTWDTAAFRSIYNEK